MAPSVGSIHIDGASSAAVIDTAAISSIIAIMLALIVFMLIPR